MKPMSPGPNKFVRSKKRLTPRTLIIGLGLLAVLIAAGLLGVTSWFNLFPSPAKEIGSSPTTEPTVENIPLSPFLFGTNLSIHDDRDQVLTSPATRAALQQIGPRIIRMPARTSFAYEIHIQTAQVIKGMGATPLVILQGFDANPNAMDFNTRLVNDMNKIFGDELVYYEYSNEEDLKGIKVERYVQEWNRMIPEMKRLAKNARFIGPVNFEYNRPYLVKFLQLANPRPDAVSWHEYACDASAPGERCISNVDAWANHVKNARSAMLGTIQMHLPIMITEWNYSPNAHPGDGKSSDPEFMKAWTTKALQTLAESRVFAAMQYSSTNTAIPLVNSESQITTQGQVFHDLYQQYIVKGQSPQAQVVSTPGPSGGTPATIPAINQGGPIVFSFEDGSTEGWNVFSKGIDDLENSATLAQDGSRILKMSLSNQSPDDFPYVSVDMQNQERQPGNGQTVNAYVYLPSNAVTVMAKLFIVNNNYHWHSSDLVKLAPGTWTRLSFTLPPDFNGPPTQLGVQFNSPAQGGPGCEVYIDAVGWQ